MLATYSSFAPTLPVSSIFFLVIAFLAIFLLIEIIILKVVVTIITNTVLDVMEKRGYKRWP